MGYTLTDRALAEIDEIADFTLANWGDGKADAYIEELFDRFEWLGENPMLGRSRDELRAGVRSWRQKAHMIFYRLVDGGIEISASRTRRRTSRRTLARAAD
jgi:toxin ParE1/3/4